MANHAHSTRTPLLPLPGPLPPFLDQGLGRQPGPVTIALAAMHAADPDRRHLRELRRRIADRIEADIALLDALAGDADLEDTGDLEPALGSIDAASHSDRTDQLRWSIGGVDDREMGDDNGIADWGGEFDQAQRFIAMGGNLNVSWRHSP